MSPTLLALLEQSVALEASDLHLMAGMPPSVRIDGDIEFLPDDPLPTEDLWALVNDRKREVLERTRDLNFSMTVPEVGRFRVALYFQRGQLEASLRIVPNRIRAFEELGLPPVVRDLVQRPAGLVLVTGPTGAGKTTALNAMVDWINSERRSRIVTIEDPIEYLHAHKRSVVIQRELDDDTYSFQGALMAALRQDPNVICLGEMRSLETVATALTAAETGHLVLGTLHTQGCCQTIERIVDVFPTSQHNQVRTQLASTLQGIVSLQLLPRMAERGRVLACEVMVGTMAVKNIIRTGKIEQLSSLIQTGGEDGMVSMDRCLRRLYESGVISYETALSRAHNQNEFRALRAVAV